MNISEQNIVRLVIEYDNSSKDSAQEVTNYLNARFGIYNYRITRSGPKRISIGKVDLNIGQMVIESELP